MATNSMVPYSNPAGNNQTTPSAGTPKPILTLPGAPAPGGNAATSTNPYVPSTVPTGPAVAGAGGGTAPISAAGAQQQDLTTQLTDIYGSGVGEALSTLLGGIDPNSAATLEMFTQSLQPSMATAQADTNAALGAGGVGANSSVAAIADSNLQAKEVSAIAGEQAQLLQSDQRLEAQVLEGIAPAAATETAQDAALPWEVASSVLNTFTSGSPMSALGSIFTMGSGGTVNSSGMGGNLGTGFNSVPSSGATADPGGMLLSQLPYGTS